MLSLLSLFLPFPYSRLRGFGGKEYYYMLTLPEDIHKNKFSRKIFTLLCDALK
jgi:hypothetical protein